MHDLFLFYYTCWLLVLIIYFFMTRTVSRSLLLVWTFVMIAVSPYTFSFLDVQIYITYLFLFVGTIILARVSSLSIYEYIVSFVCMICYVGILVWEIIAPIWFFLPTPVILAPFIVLILIYFIRRSTKRFVICFMGLTFGQLLYNIILIHYGLQDTIGALQEMTMLSIVLLLLIIVDFIHRWMPQIINQIKSFTS